jgi:hypothetical protein
MQGDQVTMKDGKMMVMRNGEASPMGEQLTLSDGTRVMPNGQVLMANGTARMMREGETMTIDRQQTGDAEDMSDKQFKEAMEDEELRDQM